MARHTSAKRNRGPSNPIARNVRGLAVEGGRRRHRPRIVIKRNRKEYDPEKELTKYLESQSEGWSTRFLIPRYADDERKHENALDLRVMIATPLGAGERFLSEADWTQLAESNDRDQLRGARLEMRRMEITSWDEVDKLHECMEAIQAGATRDCEHAGSEWMTAARGMLAMKLLENGQMTLGEGTRRVVEGSYFCDPFLGFETGCLGATGNSILGPNDEFVPIVSGPFQKQLYLYDMLLAHSRIFETLNHNPVARRIVEMNVQFPLGRGVRVEARHPAVQKVMDEFWERNNMDERLKTWARDLSWQGELFARFYEGRDGQLVTRSLDQSTIWEIVTDPEDIETVYYYHQQYQTQYQMYTRSDVPVSKYIVRQIPASDVDQVKVNASSGEKRGRSDLYSLLNYLKRLKDYYNAVVVRAQEEASHTWDVTVSGSEADAEQVANEEGMGDPPPPGSMWVHNDGITVSPMSLMHTNLGTGSKQIGEQLLALIAIGSGYPTEFLGLRGAATTRATALTAAQPSTKHIQERQRAIESLLQRMKRRILERAKDLPQTMVEDITLRSMIGLLRDRKFTELVNVLRQVVTGGGLTRVVPLDTEVEFIFPEVRSENRDEKLKNIDAVQASRSISHRRASSMRASELDITEYDFDEEMAEIKEEEEAGIGPPAGFGDDLLPGGPSEEPDDGAPPPGSDGDDKDYEDENQDAG